MDLPTFPLLGLQPTEDPRKLRLPVTDPLATPFGFLYGGSGIAASAEAAERVAGRPLVWITTQFLGSPTTGDVVDLAVDLTVEGRVTTQASVVGRIGDEVVFSSLAALTARDAGDETAFATMPDVPAPDECEPMHLPFDVETGPTFFDHLERRAAAGRFGLDAIDRPQEGPLALWCRVTGTNDGIGSPATQAFVADIVPMAICAALGRPTGGSSLDNTLRIVDHRPSEWVLLEVVADGFQRSVGHGSVRIWSDDGRLVGLAQQSALIRTSHQRR